MFARVLAIRRAIRRAMLRAALFPLLIALVLAPGLGFGDAGQSAAQRPLELTPEEKAFLAAHPVLRLGVGVAFPPFQFVEKVNGKNTFKGVVAETVRLLEQRLGVRLEPVWDITFAEALDMGRSGSIDVFPCLSWTPERDQFLTYTAPYLSYPLVIVSRDDGPFIGSVEDLQGRKVAEVKVLSNYSKLRNDYPHLAVEYVFEKDTPAMLEAVSFGRAEACIVDLAVASYVINDRGLTNLKVAAPTRWRENQLAMAVPKGKAALAGILQKALDSLSFEETDAIRQRWLGLRYSSLVNPVLFRRILLHGGGAAVLVLAVILWWNRRLRREIAGRKRAQGELVREKAFTDAIMSSVPGLLYLYDDQGRLVRWNKKHEELTGYTSEELAGMTWPDWHKDDPAEVAKVQQALKQVSVKGFAQVEGNVQLKDGSKRLYLLTGVPLVLEGRRYFTGIGIDITEHKRMQDVLIQAEKMMSLGGLAAGMAHEINNPLSGIIQGAQVILKRLAEDTPPNRKAAQQAGCGLEAIQQYAKDRQVIALTENMRDAGIRAAIIVGDMLAFSRQSASGTCAEDPAALLDKAVALCSSDYSLKKRYDFRHIRIVRDYQAGSAPIECSRSMIEQVLVNILRNAAQAMSANAGAEAAPEITLRTRQQEGRVILEIEDNGPGMDEGTRRHVFEPFFTTKLPGVGTGLGLSVSYFIITTIHGGSIEVESAPGKGTRFIITLPVAHASMEKPGAATA